MLLAVCYLALKCASWNGVLQNSMQMIIQSYNPLLYEISNNMVEILTATRT